MTVADLKAYFAGGRVVKLAREGYDEPITIPKSDAQVVEQAAHDAVKAGTLWLTSGPTTLLMEDIPPGVLTDAATLQAPPQPIPGFLTVTDFGGLDVGIPQAMRRSIDFAANSHGIGAG
jgi:hypothetical protein